MQIVIIEKKKKKGKIIKSKIFLIKVRPVSLINIGPVGRSIREYVQNY